MWIKYYCQLITCYTMDMEPRYTSVTCKTCDGSGHVIVANPKYVRQWRENENISLRECARQIGISPAYLSDMELGRRSVSDQVLTFIENY